MGKEQVIDALLCFMKEKHEDSGVKIGGLTFNFKPQYTERYFNAPEEVIPDGEDLAEFKRKYPFSDDEIDKAIKTSCVYEYIKCLDFSNLDFSKILLTEKGFARATSVEKAKHQKETNAPVQNITINQAGNVQVGNNNAINIQNTFSEIIQKIENSDASSEQKEEAKGLITKLINHPIIADILSGSALLAIQKMLGG